MLEAAADAIYLHTQTQHLRVNLLSPAPGQDHSEAVLPNSALLHVCSFLSGITLNMPHELQLWLQVAWWGTSTQYGGLRDPELGIEYMVPGYTTIHNTLKVKGYSQRVS